MKLPIIFSALALLLTLILASNPTVLHPAANIEKHTLDAHAPPANARLDRIIRPRDFIGGTNTHNPEPCASKCKDSKILNCSAVNYIVNDKKEKFVDQVHTWRCFCSDGAMCMGARRGHRGHDDPQEHVLGQHWGIF